MCNNHLLKVQGWEEWTLMRVWSVSYRFHPIDWCRPRQCLHGSLSLALPQTQCYRPSLQILLLDLWTILDLCFRRLWRLSCWWTHTSGTRWVFQYLQWNIYMFHLYYRKKNFINKFSAIKCRQHQDIQIKIECNLKPFTTNEKILWSDTEAIKLR